MAFGISFGKIKLQDNDTIFSISYNGTVRLIINKSTGAVTFGAVDGTGVSDLSATGFRGADFRLTGYLALKTYSSIQIGSLIVPEGTVVYNITDHKLKVYNGSTWETVTSA